MTPRIITQGRDWSIADKPMQPARRQHVHGALQPMEQPTSASLARWTVAGIIGGAVMLIAMFS